MRGATASMCGSAPLLRVQVAQDQAKGRWVVLVLFHHLALDHVGLEIVQEEMQAHALGRFAELPAPVPFRNFVAQARLGVSREEHEAYFRAELGDVDEATLPFGLAQVQGDGSGIAEASQLDRGIAVGAGARAGAGAGGERGELLHLAWAQVVARTSGREDVVFGTVLLGRLQGGGGCGSGAGDVHQHAAGAGAAGRGRRGGGGAADACVAGGACGA